MTEPERRVGYRLRRGRDGDIDRLRVIDVLARRRYAGVDGLRFVAEAMPISRTRLLDGETVVAVRADAPVGYVLLQPLDGFLHLASIAVLPDCSGLGIGAALIGAARERAGERGLPAVTLTTFRQPPWNGPWFRRLGFALMPDERIGPGLRAILDRHATFLDMSMRETLWARP